MLLPSVGHGLRVARRPICTSSSRLATSITSGGIQNPVEYCKALVKARDYESHLISYFWPRAEQPGFFALKAFFIELSVVPETVSNSTIGKLRFQFWRDALSKFAEDKPPQHPIALALFHASKEHQLQRYHLKRIIDAREEELVNPSFRTLDALTAHAESTYSTLLYLLLSLRHLSDSSGEFSHALSHLGIAQYIAVLLRSFPFHASRGQLAMPLDIAAKHHLRQEDVIRHFARVPGSNHIHGLEDAVYELAVVANNHLLTAREIFKDHKVPSEAIPVFLIGAPVSLYLSRLEAVNFDVSHPSLRTRDWKLPWRIWLAFRKREF